VKRWGVFVSGTGTNLQNILDLEKTGLIPSTSFVAVHADRPCHALERAQRAGKSVLLYSPKEPSYDQKVLEFLKGESVEALILLGYLRILSPEFLSHFWGPVLNLHPSLLPKYKGLRAIESAFEAGDLEMGVSLHEVVEELDSGPILKQVSWTRSGGESIEEVRAKMHDLEHKMIREYFLSLESSGGVR